LLRAVIQRRPALIWCIPGEKQSGISLKTTTATLNDVMKTLFFLGIICVALGLLSFLVKIPHAQQEQFQSNRIVMGESRTEPRRFPVGVGGTLIIGGFALMVTGCRQRQP